MDLSLHVRTCKEEATLCSWIMIHEVFLNPCTNFHNGIVHSFNAVLLEIQQSWSSNADFQPFTVL